MISDHFLDHHRSIMLHSLVLVLVASSVALILYALWQAEQRRKLVSALNQYGATSSTSSNFNSSLDHHNPNHRPGSLQSSLTLAAGGLQSSSSVSCRQSRRFVDSSIFQIFKQKLSNQASSSLEESSAADTPTIGDRELRPPIITSSSGQSIDGAATAAAATIGGSMAPTFQAFTDRFKSFKDVASAMQKAGLDRCELIVGVDFTASNEWQGRRTFNRQCLHALLIRGMNPYQQAISILGATLEPFSETGRIRAYGFGDQTTRNFAVFPFSPDGSSCSGFREVLTRYNRAAKTSVLAGPTSFAPILRTSIDLVRKSNNRFFVLIIISDGQIRVDERETIEALIEASRFPLSIIMVGVGDGPWDMMEEFDDLLPRRKFDNFQFVDFNKAVASKRNAEAVFALHALMEVPDQYKAIKQLGLLA